MEEAIKQTDAGADSLAIESAIFEAALQLANPVRRRKFLDRAFHGDPQGRKDMEDLLEMEENAATYFLEAHFRVAELAREVVEEFQDRMFHPMGTLLQEEATRCNRPLQSTGESSLTPSED